MNLVLMVTEIDEFKIEARECDGTGSDDGHPPLSRYKVFE